MDIYLLSQSRCVKKQVARQVFSWQGLAFLQKSLEGVLTLAKEERRRQVCKRGYQVAISLSLL